MNITMTPMPFWKPGVFGGKHEDGTRCAIAEEPHARPEIDGARERVAAAGTKTMPSRPVPRALSMAACSAAELSAVRRGSV